MTQSFDLQHALREAAENAPPTPVLMRYPGWAFCIEERDPTPALTRRLDIWSAFKQHGVRTPVTIQWYVGLEIGLVLGNDLSRCAYVCGSFEPNELYFLSTILHPGMVMVDAGANEGLYSALAARLVGPTGRVLSIEPSPRECMRLTANLERNTLTNAKIFAVALSDHSGIATLHVAEDEHAGQNTLGQFIYDIREARRIDVPLMTLDELVESEEVTRVDVVKMDVEGAEYALLTGARQVLARHRPIILFEMAQEALQKQGADAAELIALVRSLGYKLLAFDHDGNLVPMTDKPSHNLVALPT